MSFETKDSGQRQQFETGAQRDTQQGKGYYDCLPFHAIKRLAQLMERGAEKYNKNNWRKGIKLSRFLSSALRHLCQYAEGKTDEDHLAATLFNVAGLIETEAMIQRGLLPFNLQDIETFYNGNCPYAYILSDDHKTVLTIDREDLERVSAHSWSVNPEGVFTLIDNKIVFLEIFLLSDTVSPYVLSFKNINSLDYRKENLVITKTENGY